MTTVFIAGSIAIKRLDSRVKERISKAVDAGLDVVVGDADGVDSAVQEYLVSLNANLVTVYCSGERPRNNLGHWSIEHVHPNSAPGTRAYFTAKDIEMAKVANYGLMIWDSKSIGTLSNVIALIKDQKKSVVFINKTKEFAVISSKPSLLSLIGNMTPTSRHKAELKIKLSATLKDIGEEQFAFPV
jgi:hypothetical protein